MSSKYPKISIITPNFNGETYLEETIRSVLDQNYPNLEYIVIDGGSTDKSVEIIKKYADKIHYWESSPDNGQSDAINKGLKRATGEWVAFLNSDDLYVDNALHKIATVAIQNPDAQWICAGIQFFNETAKFNIKFAEFSEKTTIADWIDYTASTPQPGSFWKRELHDTVGYLDSTYQYVFDTEFWIRLTNHKTRFYHLNSVIAHFRLHDASKTMTSRVPFLEEQRSFLNVFEQNISKKEKKRVITKLNYLHAESDVKLSPETKSLSKWFTSLYLAPSIIKKRFFWGALKRIIS
ncbi:MAG: glycosyltransferase [Bacteroidetes bacterium]|nr:glycosyltransferase [Bacteroidota bacterium]